MSSEFHLFVIWNNGKKYFQKILNNLKSRFIIIEIVEVAWSKNAYIPNLISFYAHSQKQLDENEIYSLMVGKADYIGQGRFFVIIVKDSKPIYQPRKTTSSDEIVNINIFDAKELFRKWSGGGHLIHASNTAKEFHKDALLLFGRDFKIKDAPWDGKKKEISRNITGVGGYNSLEEFFIVLNNSLDYVVLRNFEILPNNYYFEDHGDIDLLVEDLNLIKYLTAAEKVFDEEYRVHYKVRIKNEDIYFDYRYVGDDYYDLEWEKDILKTRVFKNDIYIPGINNYFYTLLYHASVHKTKIASDYIERLLTISKEINVDICKQDFENENAKIILTNFIKKEGYKYTKPHDLSVIYNEDFLAGVPTIYRADNNIDLLGPLPLIYDKELLVSRKLLENIDEKEYWSCVYDLGDVIVKQATNELAGREASFLKQLNCNYFPKLLEVKQHKEYSVLKLEKIMGDSVLLSREKITSNSYQFFEFIMHCISILEILRQSGIKHRDIRIENIIIRNNKPVLLDFGWAVSKSNNIFTPSLLNNEGGRPLDGNHSDIYSMGKVLKFINQGKYSKFDFVIDLMIEEDSNFRIIDLELYKLGFKLISSLEKEDPIKSKEQKTHYINMEGKLIYELLKNNNNTQQQLLIAQTKLSNAQEKLSNVEAINKEVLNSKAYKVSLFLRTIRKFLIPTGSVRWKRIRKIYKALKLIRKRGIKGVREEYYLRKPNVSPVEIKKQFERGVINQPKVSIIIPVFNALALTKECLRSIDHGTKAIEYEVIVVDNASRDETREWLQSKSRKNAKLHAFHLEKNIGFGPAVNFGIKHCKGDFIVILNNDTIVSSGWLKKMIDAAKQDEMIGIISPVTNYVGEGPQIDDEAKDLPGELAKVEEYAKHIASRKSVQIEPIRLVFFCVMIKRNLIDIIGYLDETYEKGNFEDDDYCFRARMAGFKLAIARNSFVYHKGTASFKENKISHVEMMERNRVRFYEKADRISVSPQIHVMCKTRRKKNISIIVRTVNRPKALKRALRSLANQTFKDFEVVLVNDCGEDISELVEEYSSFYPITYVNHDRPKGRTGALNSGISKSQGTWLGFLDDDDILYPWHLEVLYQAALQSGKKFIYSNFNKALFYESEAIVPNILVGAPPREFHRSDLLVQNFFPIHTWLYERQCMEDAGYFNEDLDRLEDFEFLLRISALFEFHHANKVTCEYRFYINGSNSIYSDRIRTLKALKRIYDLHPVNDAHKLAEREQIIIELKRQVEKIKKINNLNTSSLTDEMKIREIIRNIIRI